MRDSPTTLAAASAAALLRGPDTPRSRCAQRGAALWQRASARNRQAVNSPTGAVRQTVEAGAAIFSDELKSYEGLTATTPKKTSWFMLHRLRLAMQAGDGKLSGEVEVDETFIGGKARNMHESKRRKVITGTGGKDKATLIGMVERGRAPHQEGIAGRLSITRSST